MNLAEWLEDTLDGQSAADERLLFRAHFEEKAQELYRQLDPSLTVEVSLLLVSPFEPDAGETWERVLLCPGPSLQPHHLTQALSTIPATSVRRRVSDYYTDVETTLTERLHQAAPGSLLYASEITDGRLYGHIVILTLHGITDAEALSPYSTRAPLSLVEAAARVFLAECSAALGDTYPPRYRDILGVRLQELLRSSACALLESVDDRPEIADGLYDAMEALSSELYEGASTRGSMAIVPGRHLRERMALIFEEPIELSPARYRHIRKLLETTRSEELKLVLELPEQPGEPLSVSGLIAAARLQESPCFSVSFKSHRNWELLFGTERRMRVAAGSPSIPKHEDLFFHQARARFQGSLSEAQIQALWQVVAKALGQVNGTIIVIAEDAQAEAQRLSATRVQPGDQPLDLPLVELVTGIDGALLLDPLGRCHAIGAILRRGETEAAHSTVEALADPSRGSRYNSAVDYVTFAPKPRLAVVISVDGSVNII